MKRLLIVGILIMGLLTGTMLFSTTAIALLGEDGLAMPEASGVTQSLRSGVEAAPGLVPVSYEDTVYASLTGYYIGKERTAIDKVYPIFINGGAGLRFLDEETWLFSADVALLQSFEGMYLNDGTTYNSDMSQADGEEFILLVLSNGLHMNAQRAVLTNRLGSTEIPANSILYFSEAALRWYCLDNQSLRYGEETALFDATLSIGDHTYDYYDLLKAIGVLQEAIDKIRDNKDPEEELNEILEILGGEDGDDNHGRRPHSGSTEMVDNQQPSAEADTPEQPGQTEAPEDDRDAQDGSGAGTSEAGGTSGKGDTPEDAPDPDVGDTEGEAGTVDSDKSGSGGSQSTATGGAGTIGGGAISGGGGFGSTGSGAGGGSAGGSAGGGSSSSSGGSGSGSTEGEHGGNPGQNTPGTGGQQGSGGATNPEAGTGESGTGTGTSGPPAYRDPIVTLTDLDAWSYALHGKLTITDPANTVIKGARIAIYREVSGSGDIRVEDGHTVYPAASYEGKTALLRKTYAGTQEFAMAPLPPGTDIYVQLTYRYNAQVDTVDEAGNSIKVVTRKTVTSDLIKLTTPSNSGIAPVAATWEECFAALDKDIQLNNLKLRNTADYDPEIEGFNYENFKKDTLSYVNRLEFTLTPVGGGEPVVLSTNSSVLRAAKEESGTTFTSSGGKLQPSTRYTYTVRAVDRYGNTMPLTANGSASFSGTLYTRKTVPTVKIEEVSNVTDQLTLKVTVSDPSGTLPIDEPLKLTVVDSSGVAAELYGSWENGDKFGDAGGSSHEIVLELAEPAHNQTYTFTLDSLAFAKSYTIRVTGSYDPQPDNVDDPRLNVVTAAVLGTARSYTASLSSGNIQFSAVTTEISDTYATLGFTMNKNTTPNILPIVDAFQLTIRDPDNNPVVTVTLALDDLDTMDYDSSTGSVLLQEANAADHTPRVELVGEESQFTGLTLWDALLLRASEGAEGSTVYSSPVQIRVSMPEGTLETSTTYQMTMESLVYKSGVKYQVPTSLTTNQFRTKKIQPKLEYDDFFVGGDVAQFIGLRIFDQDETIQQSGLVYVDLYYGETLLSTRTFYATSDPEDAAEDLVFENMIPDAAYTIVFRAAAYNDGGGFSANKQLWSFHFLGGSGLSGQLTLESLTEGLEEGYTAEVTASVEDTVGCLARLTQTPQATVSVYKSGNIVDPVYDSEPFLTQFMNLTEQEETGAWAASMALLLEQLNAGCSYKMVLTAPYRGSQVVLGTLTFRTDSAYYTISNEDELLAVNRNPDANYIVVSDFTVTKAMNISLRGTIDFQGHVITNNCLTSPLFSCVYQGAEVRNLVVDYPENAAIKKPLFSDNRGLVEDLIVRTSGTHTSCSASALLFETNRGTVRNFVVRLGGDLYLSSATGGKTSLLACSNLFGALIENGYIYGANGAGVVFARGERGYTGSILLAQSQYGTLRNVFTRMDIWFPTEVSGTDDYIMGLSNSVLGTMENVYHVGDYYLLGSEGQKNLSYRLSKERFFHIETDRVMDNLWHVSQYTYDSSQANKVSPAAPAILYETDWQRQALGDGFDVENCVPMGFYPRLKLSDCMQKYQEYLPLPALYGDAPKLVGDGMAEGFTQGNEAGAILLRFQNDRALTIRSITINGLQVNQIHSQEKAADGLWNVVVDVTALEFRSAYQVTGFTYLNGTAVQSVSNAGYTTTGVEFWKEVDSLPDWQNINNHMDWNYRLTADLDFATDTLAQGAITLNGSRTDMAASVSFTGKLDGSYYENGQQKLHTIRNLKLTDTLYPYVICRMNPGSVLSNLVIEGMTLTASEHASSKHSGFVAYADAARIENVHIRDSEFRGVGSMGALLGENGRTLTLRECSVADTVISDTGTTAEVYAGALVGKPYYAGIRSCYARNVELSIERSTTVKGVGGLIGCNSFNALQDCYATGTLRAAASQVGGIFGAADSNSRILTCWSDMDLFVTGDYVGGIGGRFGNQYDSFLLSVGNISASGENAGRLFGTGGFANMSRVGYAFADQVLTGLAEGEIGDVTGLLTSQQLGQRATWTDLIRMGSSFEYDSLSGGYFPKLLNDAGELVWGQEDIPIPGLGSDHFITIQEAAIQETVYGDRTYYIAGQWTHPGYTTGEFAAALKRGLVTDVLSVTLDGLGLTDEAISGGRASIALSEAGDGRSNLAITCSDLIKALDTYALTFKYDGISIQADVDFGTPLYHDVPDLDTWNRLMAAGHGTGGENFRITGVIDFGGGNTAYRNLKLGRLEGAQTEALLGFRNMEYDGGYSGAPWIESISGGVRNLSFTDITAAFSSGADRAGTGLVLSATTVENCKFEKVHMGCSGSPTDYTGFFSMVNGNISDVTMTNMSLSAADATTASNYGGALAGYIHGGISNLTADGITVVLPMADYVGGIIGYEAKTVASTVKNVTLQNITVEGRYYVGGFAGENYQMIQNGSLDVFEVKGVAAVGGFVSDQFSYVKDLTMKNGSVTTTSSGSASAGYTGGAIGYMREWYQLDTALVQGVTVTGSQYSGGLLGRGDCHSLKNVQILGCAITSNGSFASAGAGGVFGQRTIASLDSSTGWFEAVTVRDTEIRAVLAAGGVGGKAAAAALNRCYVAEDVTVTASGSSILSSSNRIDGCAGGVFGEIQYPVIRRTACGAKVTGARNVGGLIGELDWVSAQNAEIASSYYVGTVTATQDVAAGVIGYVNGSGVSLTTEHVKGVLVAGTITTPGDAFLLAKQRGGLTPDGNIGVWDNTVLNGQTVQSIADTSTQTGSSTTTLPASGKWYPAAKFKEWSTYEAMGFTDRDVRFSTDKYMPFVYASGTTVLPYTDTYDDEAVGILKPFSDGNPDATVVYASGVNTVNIEASTEVTSVTVKTVNGNIPCTPDDNGVVTLSYDFETGLTVDGVSYSADDLKRTVMTYGNCWYYIEDGLVYYGTGEQESTKPTVFGISNAAHLWQGQVLCDDGSVYTLSGGTATEETDETVTGISKLDTAKPFWSYTFKDIQVDVYHDFTLYGDVRVEYRMFELNGKLYSVSPYQNMVYDGVMLSLYNDNVNAAKRYYALLGQDGSLVNYLTPWTAQSFQTDGIDHISNNLGYNKQIVLARYEDGSAAGYDYFSGKLLFSTASTGTSFRAYAGAQLRGLFASFFSVGSAVATDDSFQLSEALVNEAPAEPLAGSAAPGHADADGSGQTGGHVGEADGAVSTEPGSDGAGGASGGTAGGTELDVGAAIDGTGVEGTAGAEGTSAADGSSQANGDAADGESGADGSGEDAGPAPGGESEASGAEQTGSAAEGSGSGAESASDTYYVPGRGVVENGAVTLADSAVTYTPGKGVYAEDVLLYAESLTSTADLSEALREQQAVPLVSPETRRAQVLAAMPAMTVAYDPVAGSYTAMDGAELLDGVKKTAADAAPDHGEAPAEDVGVHGGSTLEIGLGFGRTLTEGEQSGFALFAVLLAAAGALLVLIYLRVVRRRR